MYKLPKIMRESLAKHPNWAEFVPETAGYLRIDLDNPLFVFVDFDGKSVDDNDEIYEINSAEFADVLHGYNEKTEAVVVAFDAKHNFFFWEVMALPVTDSALVSAI